MVGRRRPQMGLGIILGQIPESKGSVRRKYSGFLLDHGQDSRVHGENRTG